MGTGLFLVLLAVFLTCFGFKLEIGGTGIEGGSVREPAVFFISVSRNETVVPVLGFERDSVIPSVDFNTLVNILGLLELSDFIL